MIIEPEKTEVISNIATTRQRAMRISEEGLAHIMTTLTNLYGDQQTAVVREIVANAVDSHIASGQTRHIEVALPDRFTNMFVVEDFGLGMTASELDEYYGDYGASSKRDTNTQIGAFGLGAKSPLAIANQFTVRAVKDGRLATALIQKAPNGLNTIDIVREMDTDLPNGVKVSIPIDADEIEDFNQKAHRFFKFAEPSMLLVNGVEPTSVYTSASKVADPNDPDFVAYVGEDNAESYVVMGGIPYTLSRTDMRGSLNRLDLSSRYAFLDLGKIFPVAIGTVDLTPNREGLRFTERTQQAVDKLMASFHAGLHVSAQEEIDAADDRSEVYKLITKWSSRLDVTTSDFTWRGEKIVQRIQTEKAVATVTTGWSKNSHTSSYGMHLNRDTNVLLLVGRGSDRYRSAAGYINDYCALHGLRGEQIFMFAEAITGELDTPWLTENSRFTIKDVEDFITEVKEYRKSQKPPKSTTPRDRVKLQYPVFNAEDNTIQHVDAKDIPADAYLVAPALLEDGSNLPRIFESTQYGSLMTGFTRELLARDIRAVLPDVKHFVYLAPSRKLEPLQKRAKRTFPSVATLGNGIYEEAKALAEDPQLHLYNWIKGNHENYSFWGVLAAQPEVQDPEITKLRLPDGQDAKAARLQQLLDALKYLSYAKARELVGVHNDQPDWFEWDEHALNVKYILVRHLSGYNRPDGDILTHSIQYVNTIHASTLVND